MCIKMIVGFLRLGVYKDDCCVPEVPEVIKTTPPNSS